MTSSTSRGSGWAVRYVSARARSKPTSGWSSERAPSSTGFWTHRTARSPTSRASNPVRAATQPACPGPIGVISTIWPSSSSTRSSSWKTPARPMRWYSSTVKRRPVSGMPILSVLLGESGKCPASSTMAPKPRGAVIGTLQAGAVFEADPLSSPPVPLSAMRRGGRSLLELFNISTDCELGPRFGPRSVPDALGGTQVALVGLRLDLSAARSDNHQQVVSRSGAGGRYRAATVEPDPSTCSTPSPPASPVAFPSGAIWPSCANILEERIPLKLLPAPCSLLPAPCSLLVVPFVVVVHAVVIIVFEHSGRPQDVPLDGLGVRRVRRVDRGATRVFEPARDVHGNREVLRIAR